MKYNGDQPVAYRTHRPDPGHSHSVQWPCIAKIWTSSDPETGLHVIKKTSGGIERREGPRSKGDFRRRAQNKRSALSVLLENTESAERNLDKM